MKDCLAQFCGLGIVCGIGLCLTPEGAVKRIMILGCTVMLILVALQSVTEIDHDAFSLQIAQYRELGKSLTENADRKKERLNKSVTKQEYERYLAGLISSCGVKGVTAELQLKWTEEGFWLPERVIWRGQASMADRETLAALAEAELGLGREEQEWIDIEN